MFGDTRSPSNGRLPQVSPSKGIVAVLLFSWGPLGYKVFCKFLRQLSVIVTGFEMGAIMNLSAYLSPGSALVIPHSNDLLPIG